MPQVLIREKMKIRAFEYDLARNLTANRFVLKKAIDNLAEFNYNMMIVNLEYRFDFSSCPGLAPPGSMTPELARELSIYAADKGIEFVPFVNFAGHCEGVTVLERYCEHSVFPFDVKPWGAGEQLNLLQSETRTMVSRMIADICDAFCSNFVHVGCDEIRRVNFLFPDDKDAQRRAVEEYIFFIINEFSKYGKEILIWGDMPLKYEEIMEKLPREIIICDWCYEPAGREETLRMFKEKGFRVLSCPAVPSFNSFAVDMDCAYENINKMISDASKFELDGFVLTTWQFGLGSGIDLVSMFTAYAGSFPLQTSIPSFKDWIIGFAEKRYGCKGKSFFRLLEIMDKELFSLLDRKGMTGASLVTLRCLLFRAGVLSNGSILPEGIPGNPSDEIWEPSPFRVWLYLRVLIDADFMDKFKKLADEAFKLQEAISLEANNNKDELTTIRTLAASLRIIYNRLEAIENAREAYHQAALAQADNPVEFRGNLDQAVCEIEKIRQGLHEIKSNLVLLETISGLDPAEKNWIDIHEKSLDEHIQALEEMKCDSGALIEFGEFLKRPACIKNRILWR